MNKYCKKVLNELISVDEQFNDSVICDFIDLLEQSKHIYLNGAGRSGLMIKAFANRLMHLGYSVSIVGEISNPHSHEGDLIIISSGSGETHSLISQAKVARSEGVKVVVITTDIDSSLAKLSDLSIVVPAQSKRLSGTSIQPMGSMYEQYTLILYDSIVLQLMDLKGESNTTMKNRHANFE